jgi:hypothetical protein
MVCGCALVMAASEGVQDYTSDATAALAPIKQPDALAGKLLHRLADDGPPQRMATTGRPKALTLDWDRAVDEVDEMEALLVRDSERAVHRVTARVGET